MLLLAGVVFCLLAGRGVACSTLLSRDISKYSVNKFVVSARPIGQSFKQLLCVPFLLVCREICIWICLNMSCGMLAILLAEGAHPQGGDSMLLGILKLSLM